MGEILWRRTPQASVHILSEGATKTNWFSSTDTMRSFHQQDKEKKNGLCVLFPLLLQFVYFLPVRRVEGPFQTEETAMKEGIAKNSQPSCYIDKSFKKHSINRVTSAQCDPLIFLLQFKEREIASFFFLSKEMNILVKSS